MSNYAELSQNIQQDFLKAAEDLKLFVLKTILDSKLARVGEVTKNLEQKLENLTSLFATLTPSIKRLHSADNQEKYETNFIEFYLGYQNVFNKIIFLAKDSDFLKELGYNDKQQTEIKERLLSLQRQTLETLFFNKEPVSITTIQNALTNNSYVKNIIREEKAIYAPTNNAGVYCVHVISLANAYAKKNKPMTGSYWSTKNVFWNVQNEVIPLNDCIIAHTLEGLDITQLLSTNKIIDRFIRVKKVGDHIFDYAKPLGENNILPNSIKEFGVNQKLSPLTLEGSCWLTNQQNVSINYSSAAFTVVASEYDTNLYYFNGVPRNIYSFSDDNPVDLKFQQSNKHIYIKITPKDEKQIDAICYSKHGDYRVPMRTYFYKNETTQDYILYGSQVPDWESTSSHTTYICLSPIENAVSQDQVFPGDVRFTFPANKPSILVGECRPSKNYEITKAIHFLNISRPLPSFNEKK